jgi:6-pyruvoyltetrahydropterin/6-carboxytetrahydropterin synthase
VTVFTISKDFTFAAAHHLDGLPDGHKCGRHHGHNYVVRVEVAANTVDRVGFVVDYADLGFMADYLDETFDHRDLNEVVLFNPTAENLARHLWEVVAELIMDGVACTGVGVSETPKTWAWFRP